MARARKAAVRSDGRMRVRRSYKAADGTTRVKEIYARTTEELKEAVSKFESSVSKGLDVSGAGNQTLAEFLAKWLDVVVAPNAAPNTVIAYEKAIAHLVHFLGAIPVNKITPLHIDTMLAGMSKEAAPGWTRKNVNGGSDQVPGRKRAASVVKKCFAVLQMALDKAIVWNLIEVNPCGRCKAPPQRKAEMKFYTDVQAKALKEGAAKKGLFLECLIRLALWGLRQGEIQGLRWCDVDLARSEIRIRHQGVEVDAKHAYLAKACKTRKHGCCDSMVISPPKSLAGIRSVPLDPATVQALGRLRESYVEKGLPAIGHGWVFPATKGCAVPGESFVAKKNIRRRFHQLTGRLDLPIIRFHDLRHTAISLMLARNVLPAVVMQIVGHAKLSQMDSYRHFIPAQGENPAIAAMAGLWA